MSRKRVWRIHAYVVGIVAVLTVVASLVVLVHPTLGYAAKDSIIAGADLRGSVIAIFWLLFAAAAVVATATIALLRRVTNRRAVIFGCAYGVALLIQPVVLQVLDHFF